MEATNSFANINLRLAHIIGVLGFRSTNEFAKSLNYNSSEKLSRLLRDSNNKPSVEIIADISNKFENINIEWLITGKGQPIKITHPTEYDTQLKSTQQVHPTVHPTPQRADIATEDYKEYISGKNLRILTVSMTPEGKENILFVNAFAQAGYSYKYDNPEWVSSLPTLSITGYTDGTYRAFEVKGDSMEPIIMQSDRVIGKYIENFRWVVKDQLYIVVGHAGIFVKRVEPFITETGGHFVLHSDNNFYGPIKVDAIDVIEMWHVTGILRVSINNSSRMEEELRIVREELKRLKSGG